MSASPPPRDADAEPEPARSRDDEEVMDQERPDTAHIQGMSYEFDVKEQDRWLPIANGSFDFFF